MLSSMSPTFVETPERVMVVGSPGGSYIIGMVLRATLDFMDGRSAAEIVAAPRIHHQYLPDRVQHEPGALSADELATLTSWGHHFDDGTRPWGNMQAVIWDLRSDEVQAASDPRGDGAGKVQ
jgi:gamma-glutamyltranspeptidase/glutathione hydrolase